MTTVLALDVGEKRIGVAGSDALGISAQPVETIRRTRTEDDIAHIREIALARNADRIVIGLPRNMDGSLGFQAERALAFARLLLTVDMPVLLVDERLTTKSAHNILIESGVRREKRKGIVDRIAAVHILETYLAAPAQGRKLEDFT